MSGPGRCPDGTLGSDAPCTAGGATATSAIAATSVNLALPPGRTGRIVRRDRRARRGSADASALDHHPGAAVPVAALARHGHAPAGPEEAPPEGHAATAIRALAVAGELHDRAPHGPARPAAAGAHRH